MVEPAIISLFVEGAVGAEEQGQIESIIGHTLFNTQMAKEPLLGPSIGLIKESIGGIPGSFQKAVADQTLRAAFAKTGIGIKSNLALVKFIESSGDTLKIPFEVGDISTFAQLCFNFLLLTEISEFHFDGTQYFQELPETRKSQILEAWLGGSSIDKILCPIDSHAERIDPDKFQKLMSEGFTYRFPWAISSLLLIMGAKYSVDLENINEKIIQLPSFMKFGVNNKVAAVFLSLGLPSRTLAVKLASIIPDYEVNFAVGWLRNLTFEELKSAGFSDREISMTIDIASNISRATQYEEVWTFDVKGIPFGADRRSLSMILLAGHALKLEREPMNQFDPFAIKVMHENSQLGYVPRGIARSIAPVLDLDGASFECIVTNIESGRDWSRVVAMARIRE